MSVDALDLLPNEAPASPVPVIDPAAGDGVLSNFQPRAAGPGEPLPGAAGYTTADVARACDQEMALQLDDALCRRLRLGFLDSAAASAAAVPAAEIMRERLGWESTAPQLASFARHLEKDFGYAPGSQPAVVEGELVG